MTLTAHHARRADSAILGRELPDLASRRGDEHDPSVGGADGHDPRERRRRGRAAAASWVDTAAGGCEGLNLSTRNSIEPTSSPR